jgi:ketol-acid reductoisomerase
MLKAMRRMGAAQQVEIVGEKLRDMMPWIKKNRLVDQSKN